MIALWSPSDGFSEYAWFALINNGEVVAGEYVPPPGVDLHDEQHLLDRYTGPGVIASKVDDPATLEGTERANRVKGEVVPEIGSSETYQCTVCGGTIRCEHDDAEKRRWMPCSGCGKKRFFELVER